MEENATGNFVSATPNSTSGYSSQKSALITHIIERNPLVQRRRKGGRQSMSPQLKLQLTHGVKQFANQPNYESGGPYPSGPKIPNITIG